MKSNYPYKEQEDIINQTEAIFSNHIEHPHYEFKIRYCDKFIVIKFDHFIDTDRYVYISIQIDIISILFLLFCFVSILSIAKIIFS